jgi:hypothetical protein
MERLMPRYTVIVAERADYDLGCAYFWVVSPTPQEACDKVEGRYWDKHCPCGFAPRKLMLDNALEDAEAVAWLDGWRVVHGASRD